MFANLYQYNVKVYGTLYFGYSVLTENISYRYIGLKSWGALYTPLYILRSLAALYTPLYTALAHV